MIPSHVGAYRLDVNVLETLCFSTSLLPNLPSRHFNYSAITGRSGGHLNSPRPFSGISRQAQIFRRTLPKIESLGVSLLARGLLEIAEYFAMFASLQHLKSLTFTAVASDLTVAFSYFINPTDGFPSNIIFVVKTSLYNHGLGDIRGYSLDAPRGIGLSFPYNVNIAELRELLAIVASRLVWKESCVRYR
ncbi:hypothetical protein BDN67DRAFT_1010932 [Paxillus ammoniavirescens]|nr:hypothetical protein BDN67DRAFT_1010932 [Paxillus ammoniavirescens]